MGAIAEHKKLIHPLQQSTDRPTNMSRLVARSVAQVLFIPPSRIKPTPNDIPRTLLWSNGILTSIWLSAWCQPESLESLVHSFSVYVPETIQFTNVIPWQGYTLKIFEIVLIPPKSRRIFSTPPLHWTPIYGCRSAAHLYRQMRHGDVNPSLQCYVPRSEAQRQGEPTQIL